jgi:hypothetical protein
LPAAAFVQFRRHDPILAPNPGGRLRLAHAILMADFPRRYKS